MYSLNHLLLPDHLPPCVTAQMSNPSPVFLALLTPNQRVKTTILLGLPGRRVSILFMILAGEGVEAEPGRSPLRLALRRQQFVESKGVVS